MPDFLFQETRERDPDEDDDTVVSLSAPDDRALDAPSEVEALLERAAETGERLVRSLATGAGEEAAPTEEEYQRVVSPVSAGWANERPGTAIEKKGDSNTKELLRGLGWVAAAGVIALAIASFC